MTPERQNCIDMMVSATHLQFFEHIDAEKFYLEWEPVLFQLFDNLPPKWFDYFSGVLNLMQPGS